MMAANRTCSDLPEGVWRISFFDPQRFLVRGSRTTKKESQGDPGSIQQRRK
jgi:hypothetical protein